MQDEMTAASYDPWKRLKGHFQFAAEKIYLCPELLRPMVDAGIISRDDYTKLLMDTIELSKRKDLLLLEILPSRPKEMFDVFRDILRKVHQIQLADRLESEEVPVKAEASIEALSQGMRLMMQRMDALEKQNESTQHYQHDLIKPDLDSMKMDISAINSRSPTDIAEVECSLGPDEECRQAVLDWKITEIGKKRSVAESQETSSIYSDPFYTSQNGYKMCARVHLNGEGVSRNKYMSLYFIVMKGEYDSFLQWPFLNKVTLFLVDQANLKHIQTTIAPNAGSASFTRPEKERNLASGCCQFVPLSTLDSGGYIQNDSMIIKVFVDLACESQCA
jgi:hypothetical protein